MKHAEIAAFFGRYDDAEKLYIDLDRKYDLCLRLLFVCLINGVCCYCFASHWCVEVECGQTAASFLELFHQVSV